MPTTYEPIATQTLGSTAASITFSSIPSTYTDLKIILVGTASSALLTNLKFNNDTGSNYSRTQLDGDGATASSTVNSNNGFISMGLVDSTTPAFQNIDIFSYNNSKYKTVLGVFSNDYNGSGNTRRIVGLWLNTAAITTVTLSLGSGTYSVGTTATLYGIKAA